MLAQFGGCIQTITISIQRAQDDKDRTAPSKRSSACTIWAFNVTVQNVNIRRPPPRSYLPLTMSWLKSHTLRPKVNASTLNRPVEAPPAWTPAPEQSHTWGLRSDVPADEFEAAEEFCERYPMESPRLLSSSIVERIEVEGSKLWTMERPISSRFVGQIVYDGGEKGRSVTRVVTKKSCGDVCLMSNLPLLAGLYEIQGKSGVYYEICIRRMDGIIAIGMHIQVQLTTQHSHLLLLGTACRPYPDWRFPGWNRDSAGLHLDDMRKFFEDPKGGRDYTPILQRIHSGDTVGCGYEFSSSTIFFTYNGLRLPDAFGGVYVPRTQYDVYAAIGIEGICEFEVNFGGDVFRWKEGNEWGWRVEGHVGRLSGTSGGFSDQLPSYEEAREQ